ncbi:MAG: hypothetical protein JKY70_06915 [Mucilaginibacter sp.]|nr:hypothetical protein [Mucilaginibacter sp.]
MKINVNKWLVLLIVMAVTGCASKSSDGTYVAILKSEYSIAEDTVILKGDLIVNRVGYHRIMNGKWMPKQFKVKRWQINAPDAPVIEVGINEIYIGSTTYKLISR